MSDTSLATAILAIKQTELSGITIVMAKFPDQYQLKPYKVDLAASCAELLSIVADFMRIRCSPGLVRAQQARTVDAG
jgi:hypothetical protein